MVITQQKKFEEILKALGDFKKIFIVGCGDCAATCKTGGEPEVLDMKKRLEEAGKIVTGYVVPEAPCVAAQLASAFAKNRKALEEADGILVLACGGGTQSVGVNNRPGKRAISGCDTLFIGYVDKAGVELGEYCSACGDCILNETGGICPITRCTKGLLNGPCGGSDKGKCEVDKERDCAWALIFEALKKEGSVHLMKEVKPPKDFSKTTRPHKVILGQ